MDMDKHTTCILPIFAVNYPLDRWSLTDHGDIISAESKWGKVHTYEKPPWKLTSTKRIATVRRTDMIPTASNGWVVDTATIGKWKVTRRA